MRILIAVPILGSLIILQSAVISYFPLLQGTADIVLITIIAWAIQKRVKTAYHWGIIGALMMGFVSEIPYFAPLIGYLLAVALTVALRQRIWQTPILAMLVAVFLGTLLVNMATIIILSVQGTHLPFLQSVNLVVVPSLVLNLLISLPFYTLLGDLAKWLYPEVLEM